MWMTMFGIQATHWSQILLNTFLTQAKATKVGAPELVRNREFVGIFFMFIYIFSVLSIHIIFNVPTYAAHFQKIQ